MSVLVTLVLCRFIVPFFRPCQFAVPLVLFRLAVLWCQFMVPLTLCQSHVLPSVCVSLWCSRSFWVCIAAGLHWFVVMLAPQTTDRRQHSVVSVVSTCVAISIVSVCYAADAVSVCCPVVSGSSVLRPAAVVGVPQSSDLR